MLAGDKCDVYRATNVMSHGWQHFLKIYDGGRQMWCPPGDKCDVPWLSGIYRHRFQNSPQEVNVKPQKNWNSVLSFMYCSFGIIKQLLPPSEVDITIVHPRDVVFPWAKARGKTTSLRWTIVMGVFPFRLSCKIQVKKGKKY